MLLRLMRKFHVGQPPTMNWPGRWTCGPRWLHVSKRYEAESIIPLSKSKI